jgi:hypothetical protein
MLKSMFDDIEEAVKSGTFDEKEDRHLTRTPMVVDKEGWGQVNALLLETYDKVMEIQSESQARLAKSGDQGINTKVEMLHFLSPEPS